MDERRPRVPAEMVSLPDGREKMVDGRVGETLALLFLDEIEQPVGGQWPSMTTRE